MDIDRLIREHDAWLEHKAATALARFRPQALPSATSHPLFAPRRLGRALAFYAALFLLLFLLHSIWLDRALHPTAQTDEISSMVHTAAGNIPGIVVAEVIAWGE